MSVQERMRWATVVALLVLMILALLTTQPRPVTQGSPRSVVVEVVNGPTVLSTQVVPLR